MATQHKERLLYYALMATPGRSPGASCSTTVARKGGEAFLRKRFNERHVDAG